MMSGMVWLARTLTGLVAVEHFYILVLEMFLWRTPRARRIFGTSADFAAQTVTMAANQGLYNGFLASGLVLGLALRDQTFVRFLLACVIVAGLYGGYTVKPRIYWVQAAPAALALVVTVIA